MVEEANLEEGDRIRVDITDKADPDFQWHGEHGTIVRILEDDAGEVTGDPEDSTLYRISITDYDFSLDLRRKDIRPPLHE